MTMPHRPVIGTVSRGSGGSVIVTLNPPGEVSAGNQQQRTECSLGDVGTVSIQVTHYHTVGCPELTCSSIEYSEEGINLSDCI